MRSNSMLVLKVRRALTFAVLPLLLIAASEAFARAPRSVPKPTPVVTQTTIGAQLDNSAATSEGNSPLAWYDASLLTLEGKGFTDTPTTYSRLPVRAEANVTSTVWFLSKNTA